MNSQQKPKAKSQQITVKVNEANPEPLEVLAKAIIEVSDAFIKLQNGPLERRTIVLLLKDYTGLAGRDIEKVLDAAPKLKTYYLKRMIDYKDLKR